MISIMFQDTTLDTIGSDNLGLSGLTLNMSGYSSASFMNSSMEVSTDEISRMGPSS